MHIEMDLLNNFKRLGVQAVTLNGRERLELMHQQFHMGDLEKFCLTGNGWRLPGCRSRTSSPRPGCILRTAGYSGWAACMEP